MGLLRFHLPWSLFAVSPLGTTAQLDNHTITIGVYGPFSSAWAAPSLAALALADLDFRKTFDAAVRDRFRTNPGVPMPNAHPKLRLRLIVGDDAEKVNTGLKTVLDFVKGPQGRPVVNAVLGGYFSEIAKPVASLCSTMEVVNIAYGGQSAEFSNKDLYPYFFRVLPADSGMGNVLWTYVKTFLWRSAVVLYSEEATGQGIFGSMMAAVQLDGRGASLSGVGLKAMVVDFNTVIARGAVQRVKLANCRLVIIIIGGNLEVNTRAVMRQERVTSPTYQFMSSHTTPSTVTRSADYADFDNWHTNNANIVINQPLQVALTMWPKMTPADVLGQIQTWGIDQWIKPLNTSYFTSELFSASPRSSLAIMALLYNSYWALVLAFNNMLNAGYQVGELHGALLRSYLRNVSFDGIAQSVRFDQNQDGVADYSWQYLDTAPPGQAVTWAPFYIYLDKQKQAVPHPSAPLGPRWATGEFSLVAPRTLAGCRPGTYLDENARVCAPCPEGRISVTYDATECSRCPAGSREVDRLGCELCSPGTASQEGSSRCSPCEAGSANEKSGQRRCAQCGLGRSQALTGRTACDPCAPGTAADSPGSVACTLCPRGYWLDHEGGVECQRCPKGSYSDRLGSLGCETCSLGTETEGAGAVAASECVCAFGTFLPINASTCATCPEGMECKVGSFEANILVASSATGSVGQYPKLLPGYWASRSEPLSVFRCKTAVHCPGRDPETCGAGLVGPACALCEGGTRWDGTACRRCTPAIASTWFFPGLPLMICPIVLLILYRLFGDGLERWGSWQNGCSCLAFVLLNHFQVLELLMSAGLAAPKVMEYLFSGVTVDLVGVFKVTCSGYGGFEAGLIMRILAPSVLVANTCLLYATFFVISRLTRRPWLRLDRDRLWNVFMSVIFTFFIVIAALSMVLFKCSKNPNGKRTLTADLSIECYSSARWSRMLAASICAVAIYCVGLGALMLRAVILAPSHFERPGFAVRWKFLFLRFRPDVYWWSLILLAKNLLLNIGFVVFEAAAWQLYHVMIVIQLYLMLLVRFYPYRHRAINMVEVWVGTALVTCISMMTLFTDGEAGKELANWAAPAVAFVPLVRGLIALTEILWPIIFPSRAREAQVKTHRLVVEFTNALEALEGPALADFVAGLTEWDRWYLDRVADIILPELLDKMGTIKRWKTSPMVHARSIGQNEAGASWRTAVAGSLARLSQAITPAATLPRPSGARRSLAGPTTLEGARGDVRGGARGRRSGDAGGDDDRGRNEAGVLSGQIVPTCIGARSLARDEEELSSSFSDVFDAEMFACAEDEPTLEHDWPPLN